MLMFTWMVLPVLLTICAGVYLYSVIYRGIRYFRKEEKKGKQRLIAGGGLILLFFPMAAIGSVWVIVLLHFGGISLALDLAWRIVRRIKKKPLGKKPEKIYYSSVTAVILAALLLSYGYWNMHHIVETDYTVHTDKVIREEGYRIALIADLHYGLTMDGEKLVKEAGKIQNAGPDLVILAGDIVDESTTAEQMREAFKILGQIESTYGTYFVYGNHDRQPYSDEPHFSASDLEGAIEEGGIQVLEDSHKVINDELILIGRADRGSSNGRVRAGAEQLIEGLDTQKELILLDHQPCEYGEAERLGYDLVLSGHTHAGQIWPGGLFASLMEFDDQNFGYEVKDSFHTIVTAGIAGWGYPIRTEKHSEFVMITIKI